MVTELQEELVSTRTSWGVYYAPRFPQEERERERAREQARGGLVFFKNEYIQLMENTIQKLQINISLSHSEGKCLLL